MSTISITDMYMPILSMLSDDDKLDLIEKLTRSMHSKYRTKVKRPDIRICFSGEWEPEKTATQVADELRAERHFTDKGINW